jgi:hypothetical protein
LFRRFKRAPWWVHVLTGVALLAVLNGIALAVVGALYLDYTRERGPLSSEIPPQSAVAAEERMELARRFAPVLRYHTGEPFVPISRSAYVSRTQLKEQEGRFVRLLNASPAEDQLPDREGTCLRSRGCLLFLDVRGVEPDPPKRSHALYDAIENQLLRSGQGSTVYVNVTHYDDTDEYAVQYWFLYLFNFRLNEHESDWEQITIRLDSDKEPTGVFYSAHEGGGAGQWEAVQRQGEHPVVYVALGAHANYFRPGRHRVPVGCKRVIGSITRCVRGRKFLVDVANGQGRTMRLGRYKLAELVGQPFIGSYGTGNYVVLTRRPDILSDPRTRGAWLDPLRPLR